MINNELVTDYLVCVSDKNRNIVYYNTMRNLVSSNNENIEIIQEAINEGGGIFLSDKSNYRVFDMIFDDRKVKYIDPLEKSFRSLLAIRVKGIIFDLNNKTYFITINSFIVYEDNSIYDRTILQPERCSIIAPFKFPDDSGNYYMFKIDLQYDDEKSRSDIMLIGNTNIEEDIKNIKYFCEIVAIG